MIRQDSQRSRTFGEPILAIWGLSTSFNRSGAFAGVVQLHRTRQCVLSELVLPGVSPRHPLRAMLGRWRFDSVLEHVRCCNGVRLLYVGYGEDLSKVFQLHSR
jgi:hypothetical protein